MAELVQLSLRAGIDESVDPKQIPAGTLLVGENCRQDKLGRLRKRRGTTALAKTLLGGGSVNAGERILPIGDSLGVFDGRDLKVYSEALAKWQTVDRPTPMLARQTPLIDAIKSAESVDQAVASGLMITLYEVSDGDASAMLYIFVREIATGAIVLPPTLVTGSGGGSAAPGTCPRIIVRESTGLAYAIWNTVAGTAYVRVLTLSTLTLGSPIVLATGLRTESAIDAQISGAYLFFVGNLTAGADRIKLIRFTLSDVTFATSATVSGGGAISALNFCLDASDTVGVHVAYSTSSLTRLIRFNYAASSVLTGPTTIFAGASPWVFVAAADTFEVLFGHVYIEASAFMGTISQYKLTTFLVQSNTHAITANSRRETFGLIAPSKPFRIGERWYCRASTFVFSSTADVAPGDSSSVIVEIRTDAQATFPPHRHVATLENQTAWFSSIPNGHLTQPAIVGNTVYIAASYKNRVFTKFDDAAVAVPLGWNQYELTFEGGNLHKVLTLGRISLGVGAAPYVLDGATTMPAGFAHAPVLNAIESATVGNLDDGVYQYVATYAWRDARGVLHRSIPSSPVRVEVVVLTGSSIDLELICTGISTHQSEITGFGDTSASPVMIELWRTLKDGGDFYRRTVEPLYATRYNAIDAYLALFNDGSADDNIGNPLLGLELSSQPQIYTVQELEDVPPPAAIDGVVHRGRFALLAADGATLWMSKVAGEDAAIFPGFHEALTLPFDRRKYALATLDERMVVFGADNIDLVDGDGPDSNGDQNTWRVTSLQTDVGCTNPRSVVAMPSGVMFQSGVDIMLLGRELAVTWAGRSVADRLAAFPTITSAVLVSEEHEVRFTCLAANEATGIVLVYDYERSAWYVRKYFDADGDTVDMPIVDAALVNGVYTMLLSSGRVYRETSASCLDAAEEYVSMVAEIYVAPAGNQGWHRLKDVQLLGTALTNHDITIDIARDFGTSFEQTKTFLAETDVTTPGPLEQARVTVARQKGQAFRVRVSDAEPTSGTVGTGEGFMLEGLACFVQRKSGSAKVSASRKG